MPAIRINSKIYKQDHNRDMGTLAIKLPMNSTEKKSRSDIFNMSYTTEEQSISNLVNLLLTKSGERYMEPNFGVGLMYYIFEQATLEMEVLLKTHIQDQIAIWMPYIVVQGLKVNSNDEHGVNIILQFQVTEHGANREIAFLRDGDLIEIGIT